MQGRKPELSIMLATSGVSTLDVSSHFTLPHLFIGFPFHIKFFLFFISTLYNYNLCSRFWHLLVTYLVLVPLKLNVKIVWILVPNWIFVVADYCPSFLLDEYFWFINQSNSITFKKKKKKKEYTFFWWERQNFFEIYSL